MIWSNTFLLFPVFFSLIYKEYLYLFFSIGIAVFSTLYHLYSRKRHHGLFKLFRMFDWLFAIGSFTYMYLYSYLYMSSVVKIMFIILLTLVILFFFYGWKRGDYEKLHPWFHIIAGIVSAGILIAVNI